MLRQIVISNNIAYAVINIYKILLISMDTTIKIKIIMTQIAQDGQGNLLSGLFGEE